MYGSSGKRKCFVQSKLNDGHDKNDHQFRCQWRQPPYFDEQIEQQRADPPPEHSDQIETAETANQAVLRFKIEKGVQEKIVDDPARDTQQVGDLIVNAGAGQQIKKDGIERCARDTDQTVAKQFSQWGRGFRRLFRFF